MALLSPESLGALAHPVSTSTLAPRVARPARPVLRRVIVTWGPPGKRGHGESPPDLGTRYPASQVTKAPVPGSSRKRYKAASAAKRDGNRMRAAPPDHAVLGAGTGGVRGGRNAPAP
ncbi:hypothetical protein GCM10027515_01760 [Schumannella luteola]